MSTNQINNSPGFIEYLRRKALEQQNGAWSERTGIDSIDNILHPSAFPRLSSATQADSQVQPTQINPAINPMSRVADLPVTDTLQPPSPGGFINPELGNAAINTPRIGRMPLTASEAASSPIINAAQNQPPTATQQVQPAPTLADQYLSKAVPEDSPEALTQRTIAPAVADTPQINPAMRIIAAAQNTVLPETRISAQTPTIASSPIIDAAQNAVPLDQSSATRVRSVADSGDTRPRIVDPLQHSINKYMADVAEPLPPAKKGFGHRILAGLKTAGDRVLQTGSLASAPFGFVEGVANPQLPSKIRRDVEERRDLGDVQNQIGIQSAQARVQQEQANADWMRRRPDIMVAQANARTLKAQQDRVKANLQMKRGQAINPNNPKDAQLLADAQAAGYQIDPDEWNNSARNDVMVTKIDPDNPTQTRRVLLNKATLEEKDLGQAGYVSPVDAQTGVSANVKYSADQAGARQTTALTNADDIKEQEWNRGEQDKYERRDQERQQIAQLNANVDAQLTDYEKLKGQWNDVLNNSASPREQTKARQELQNLDLQITKTRALKKADPGEYQRQTFKRPTLTVPQGGGVARQSATPKSDPAGLYR